MHIVIKRLLSFTKTSNDHIYQLAKLASPGHISVAWTTMNFIEVYSYTEHRQRWNESQYVCFKSFGIIFGRTVVGKSKIVALVLRKLHFDDLNTEESPICCQITSPSVNRMTVLSRFGLNG